MPDHLAIEHGAAHQFADIVVLHLGFRRAREGGKLIDHAGDVADLTYDGLGATLEDIAILRDRLAVFAADALGGKLDRRQGFLISWAMRRATSAQAAVRCAATSSVTSSKVMTEPRRRRPPVRGARAHEKVRPRH